MKERHVVFGVFGFHIERLSDFFVPAPARILGNASHQCRTYDNVSRQHAGRLAKSVRGAVPRAMW